MELVVSGAVQLQGSHTLHISDTLSWEGDVVSYYVCWVLKYVDHNATLIKMAILFCVLTSCSVLGLSRRFGGIYCCCFQGTWNSLALKMEVLLFFTKFRTKASALHYVKTCITVRICRKALWKPDIVCVTIKLPRINAMFVVPHSCCRLLRVIIPLQISLRNHYSMIT